MSLKSWLKNIFIAAKHFLKAYAFFICQAQYQFLKEHQKKPGKV
jgi:hypothetical protein